MKEKVEIRERAVFGIIFAIYVERIQLIKKRSRSGTLEKKSKKR